MGKPAKGKSKAVSRPAKRKPSASADARPGPPLLEELSRGSELSRFGESFMLSPDINLIVVDGKILFANDQARHVLGNGKVGSDDRTLGGLAGKRSDQILVEKYDDIRMPNFMGGERYHAKVAGSDRSQYFMDVVTFQHEYMGRTATWIMMRDITEQKKIEERLLGEKEMWKVVFDYSPVSLIIVDMKGNFMDANKASEDILGYKKDEFVGRSTFAVPFTPTETKAKILSVLPTAIFGKIMGPVDAIYNHKDGHKVILEQRAFCLNMNGKNIILIMSVDVTEQRKTQKYLEQLNDELSERIREIESEMGKAGIAETERTTRMYKMNKLRRTLEEILEGKP